jgi:hypothetical protein
MGTGDIVKHDDTPREHAGTLFPDGGTKVSEGSTVALNFGWSTTLGTKEINECSLVIFGWTDSASGKAAFHHVTPSCLLHLNHSVSQLAVDGWCLYTDT